MFPAPSTEISEQGLGVLISIYEAIDPLTCRVELRVYSFLALGAGGLTGLASSSVCQPSAWPALWTVLLLSPLLQAEALFPGPVSCFRQKLCIVGGMAGRTGDQKLRLGVSVFKKAMNS